MKNLKRIIALVAVFAMVLTTVSFAATYTDIAADNDYYEAVETLSKLNIVTGYEDGEYKADQNVTRAEMTALIARVLGIGETAKNQMATSFTDVPASHWASGFVAWASSSNVVKGYGDGTFGPENNVLYEEAVTMIMRALGYEVVAAAKGGYPGGFIATAIQSGVTTDVKNAVQGTFANRGTLAQLLANAIDTPLVDQSSWNTDGTGSYVKFDGNGNEYKTLMSEYLNVVKVKGIVTATPYHTEDIAYNAEEVETVGIFVTDVFETENETVQSWVVEVDEEEEFDVFEAEYTSFNIAGSDAAEYFAKSVLAYVHENADGEWEIISIVPDSSRSADVTFPLENYDGIVDNKLSYFKDGAEKATKVNLNAEYVVFGDLEAEGRAVVTLIDNAKTAGYEVVKVEEIATDIVDKVTDTKISFKNGYDTVKYTDDDLKVVVVKDGVAIEAADLAANDVVAITGTDNLIKIEVLTKTIEGKIAGRKAVDGGYAYRIDGTYYELAAGATGEGTLNNGFEGTFYLDKFDDIVYYEGEGVVGDIAYALEVSTPDTDKWGKSTLDVKLLTTEGAKTYEVADKLYIDGEDYILNGDDADAEGVAAAIQAVIDGDAIVKFSLASNKISKIYTTEDTEIFETVAEDTLEWNVEDNAFANYDIDKNAIVFSIAEDVDDSFVATLADFIDEDRYAVKLYATVDGTSADADIIVAADLEAVIASKAELAIITDIAEDENEDEEDIYELTIAYEGEEKVYLTTADVYADNEGLAIGDVIQFRADADGVITKIDAFEGYASVARYDEGFDEVTTSVAEDVIAGYAFYIKGNTVHVECGDEAPAKVKFDKARRIYLVETKVVRGEATLKVTEGEVADIAWDADLVEESEDEGYVGKDVAVDPATELVEGTAANVYTQIVVTYDAEGEVDMIFLIAGEDDYEIAD